MALFNYATKEITLKIVYYGPGLSGKTTNLQHLHSMLNPETRGRLLSLSTETDRTLFFDFLPVELGKIRDFSVRFQLYTVPGQVRYNATRKIVLKGADAVIFVADSQRDMKEQNVDSFTNMKENLSSNNINPDEIPIILQYNKRDLSNIASLEELNTDLNQNSYPVIEACAINGSGVEESFKLITKLLLKSIAKRHQIEIKPAKEEEKEEEAEVVSREASPLSVPASSEVQASFSVQKDLPSGVEAGATSAQEASEVPSSSVSEPESPPLPQPQPPPTLQLDKIYRAAEEISEIHGILADIKNSVYLLSQDMEILRGLKKEQEETISLLKDLYVRFKALKKKRRWFGF